ncbi:MAG: OB-fold nucleic acid binding domain-containing protein [Acidobacteriota bacterium]
MTKCIRLSICGLVLFGVVGCSSQSPAKADSAVPPPAASAAAVPAPAAAQPQTPAPVQNGAPQSVTGTVLETMNAANYTYVRVKAPNGELWAATAQFKVAVGDRVVVPLETPMSNFHSQSLKRDFPLIYFVARIGREGESVAPATPAATDAPPMMSAHATPAGPQPTAATPSPNGPHAANPAQPVTGVTPAPGGATVADIWAKRKTLGGQTVTVRGKVVKFNGGILGVNWIHLQDGTGSAKDGTHDITVTSTENAKMGDVVTVTGKVTLNKDFGAGYSYAVIIEGASVAQK